MTTAKLLKKPAVAMDSASTPDKERLLSFQQAFDALCQEHGIGISIRIALNVDQKPQDVLRYLVATLENDPDGFAQAFERKILAVPVIVPNESS